ncbi:Isoprenylcysteine carboxyl methyltransferase family-domain-containing protein [Morchella snyderi]|nr:Isoprenylcysteine carboxyl methyltransferase family-domain-containing protein [Morchella snyderi]
MSEPDRFAFPPRSSSRAYNPPARSSYPGSPNFEPPSYLYPGHPFALDGIALRAGALGAVAAGSFAAAWQFRASYWQLPMFAAALAVFHFFEFWTTARFNTRKAEVKSFLLTSNGAAWNTAHASAFAEALLEVFFFPQLKMRALPTLLGLLMMVVGQLARSYAMAHAGTNFTHLVAMRHEQGHALVTDGIYAWLRHPSYFGFFWWGLGTQLMLGNPLCAVGYTAVLWTFFSRRIAAEERLLVEFFGDEYVRYRERTRTWIPLVG